MAKKHAIYSVLFLMILIIAGCGRQKVRESLDEIKVQLGWYHQAQWAGFYAADQLGHYSAEGLAVKLLPRPEPRFDQIGYVMDGKADFGTTNGVSVITAGSQGSPIVAITAIYRRNPQVFMTLSDSGISRPHDFPGHTIRTLHPLGNGVIFRALMGRVGLDPESVTQVEAGYDMSPFYERKIDIWPGFLTAEVLSAREQGYGVNVILPSYYGVHLYGMVIFTTDRLVSNNPDLVLRFLRATLRGWLWSVENLEEAALLSLEYDESLDKEHEIALYTASVPLIHTGEDQIGWMRDEVWQETHDMLLEQGILTQPIDIGTLYTMDFLNSIYGEE